MEEINKNTEDSLDEFLNKKDELLKDEKVIKDKGELVEKVDKKLVVEDGRELLREITYDRY
jgi:hypothetical protein